MDTAYCTKDDRTWDADELRKDAKNHPDQWLIDRRQSFICRGCEEKARFINYNGKRIAHFGIVRGTQHNPDCDFLGDPTGGLRNNNAGGQLATRPPAAGNKVVRYDKPGPLHPTASSGSGGTTGSSPKGGAQPAGNAPLQQTTGLQTLLKNLRNGADYPPANLWLDVPARGTGVGSAVLATDYFRRIGTVPDDPEYSGVTRAFWGYVDKPEHGWEAAGQETLWINCDDKKTVLTIRVGYKVKDELFKALGITKPDELKKTHVIVEGVAQQGNSKFFIPVTDIKKSPSCPNGKRRSLTA